MTTRQQILRSSTPGQVPAAGTRQPGELWTTFPDLQLGVIDASRNAQKLVAVRYFSASANYAAGDFVIQAGALYVAKGAVPAGAFNASQWTKVAAATDAGGPYLPIAGGTLTGPLLLAADPGAALGAATKQYVDGTVMAAPFLPIAGGTMAGMLTLAGPPTDPTHAATKAYVDSGAFMPIAGGTMTGDLILNRNPQVPLGAATKQYVDVLPVAMNDNRVINGDMRIDAHNNGASGTATQVYAIDRWYYQAAQTGKLTWGRNFSSPLLPPTFPYCLGCQSPPTVYTPLAADYFCFVQPIEADMISDFAWGTSNAQPVTLSFWAMSSTAGTYSGSIRNYAGTRAYPFTYPLAASAWTKVIVTIPGDTGGAWVQSGNGGGAFVSFDLGSGANFRGLANAWGSGNFTGATGAVRVVSLASAQFFVTGVKLEIGSVATPYNRQSLAKSMADCQRYYQKIGGAISQDVQVQGYVSTAGMGVTNTIGIYPMRAAPTAVIVGAFSQTNVASVNLFGGSQTLVAQIIATAAGTMQWSSVGTTAYVTLNAEL